MNEQMNIGANDARAEPAEKIIKLMSLTRFTQILSQIAQALHQQNRQSIAANSVGAEPEALEATLKLFDEEFKTETPVLMATVQALYGEVMGEDTIDAALAFYESEAGQAFLASGQQLEARLQQVAQAWAKAAGKAAFDRALKRASDAE